MRRVPLEKRKLALKLYGSGMSFVRVAAEVGCNHASVFNWVRAAQRGRKRNKWRLSLEEREEISVGLKDGESLRSVARRLGRAPSTISREVKAVRQHKDDTYRAWRGDERAERLMARPKPRKLESSLQLVKAIEAHLREEWSPRQIAARLRVDYPDDATMRVSHETIYKALYLQGRGTLRQALKKHLRQGRPRRRRQRPDTRGKIADMVNISQRPSEADDRAVPGHWEGDLIMGKANKSAIVTLVERATRYVMLVDLPDGKSAEHVRLALTQKIQQLPVELHRSLTWDQGKELAEHLKFSVDTGVQVYFCDPHSPWQRGSNENTNGLLRQYFPKGTDLSVHSPAELDRIARKLNGRPRETLGWRTPAEKLDTFLRLPTPFAI
jgi:transposase, IS30 family